MDAGKKFRQLAALLLFPIYFMLLIYFLFFDRELGRVVQEGYRYNLVPFREILRYIRYADKFDWKQILLNLGGNILVFVPLGYYLPRVFARRIRTWQTTLLCCGFSFTVELIQLVTRVGSFDIDDVILNTIGGFLGCVICRALGDDPGRKDRPEGEE